MARAWHAWSLRFCQRGSVLGQTEPLVSECLEEITIRLERTRSAWKRSPSSRGQRRAGTDAAHHSLSVALVQGEAAPCRAQGAQGRMWEEKPRACLMLEGLRSGSRRDQRRSLE